MSQLLSSRAIAWSAIALLAHGLGGCASVTAPNPAGYGSPPSQASAAEQIQNYVGEHWADRKPENASVGTPQKAHHMRLGMGGDTLDWQGYGVSVTMDINTKGGDRIIGRKYAALFSGDKLVGMVDYPGQANVQHTMALYWDADSTGPVAALPPQAAGKPVAPVAKPVQSAAEMTPLAIKPVARPQAAPDAGEAGAVAPATPVVVATPAVARPEWVALSGVPPIGIKVYLASDKSYIGTVQAYEPDHAYANGLVTPSVRVRYSSGSTDWFPMSAAAQIYAVQPVR